MSYTTDLSDGFFARLESLCVAVECDPFDLLGVWKNESNVSATAHNLNGHASGIYQAMPATLRLQGFTGTGGYVEPSGAYQAACRGFDGAQQGYDAAKRVGDADLMARFQADLSRWAAQKEALNAALSASFRSLDALAQLPWAERYYRPYKGKLVNKAACYVATFLPADIELASNPDAILSAKVGSPALPAGRRGWAFTANAGFDVNGDLAIQVRELESAIARACVGPRWNEIVARMRTQLGLEEAPPPTVPEGVDLGTPLGLQRGLNLFGYHLDEDGNIGPKTREALRDWQAKHGLDADGLYGPRTRDALSTEIFALEHPPTDPPPAA